jgi:hypothetical protein
MGNSPMAYQDSCHFLNAYAEGLGRLMELPDCQIWLLTPENEGRTWYYSVFPACWNLHILLLPPGEPAVKLVPSQSFLGLINKEVRS